LGTFVFSTDKIPRPCVRTLDALKRCTWVNEPEDCVDEYYDMVEICPTWALEEFKQKARTTAKIIAIQNQTLDRSLEVSSYNKGRSLKDVSDRTWIHGTRKYLRPDTMYPDERYTNITQKEINEAKVRY
jgi:hypothetical protein